MKHIILTIVLSIILSGCEEPSHPELWKNKTYEIGLQNGDKIYIQAWACQDKFETSMGGGNSPFHYIECRSCSSHVDARPSNIVFGGLAKYFVIKESKEKISLDTN